MAYDTKLGRETAMVSGGQLNNMAYDSSTLLNGGTHPPSPAALDAILICCRDKNLIRCSQDSSIIARLSQVRSKMHWTQNK